MSRTRALTPTTSGACSVAFALLSSAELGLNVKLNPLEKFWIEGGAETGSAAAMGVDEGPEFVDGIGACGETGVEAVEEGDDSAWKLNLNLLGSLGIELKPVNGVGRDVESGTKDFKGSATGSLSLPLSAVCISTSSISSIVTSLCKGFARDEGRP